MPMPTAEFFIRCSDPTKVTGATSYEVNIFDKRPDPSYGTGAIVNVAKPSTFLKAANQWNTYEITAKGPQFTITLNGVRTVDGAQDTKFPRGAIALQYGGGVVKFRKVEIAALSVTNKLMPSSPGSSRRPRSWGQGHPKTVRRLRGILLCMGLFFTK